MSKFSLFLCAAMLSGVAANYAEAQSIQQQDQIVRYQPDIKSATDQLNVACGSKIETKIDWASFAKEDWSKHSAKNWCLEPLANIRMQCQSSAAFKSAFASKIQTYSCVEGTPGNDLFSINGSDFKLSIDWDATKLGYRAVDYLQKNL